MRAPYDPTRRGERSPGGPGEQDRSLPAPGAGLVLVGALAALGLRRQR